jgi:hypothetical protein
MTSVRQLGVNRPILTEAPAASVSPTYSSDKPATRADIALLVCALFLQRFFLPFLGDTALSLDLVVATLIFVYQFGCGRLLIQYDRLLWFLVLVLASIPALLINLGNARITSYGMFLILYFFFTLTCHSSKDQYKNTLLGFQFLMLILSSLSIAQFFGQFVLDGGRLIMFYGIFPDSVVPAPEGIGGHSGWNTISRMDIGGSSLIRSNGIFLLEPGTMGQMAALAILIEVLEFRRPRYLIPLVFGLLLAYSGTGISILVFSLPIAVLVNRGALLPALLICLLAFGLLATGIIDSSTFTSRVGEFQDTKASGFIRFVSPIWMASDYLDTASAAEILFGKGPGYGYIKDTLYAATDNTWLKAFIEYGLVGAAVLACFLGSCFRKTRCPAPVIVGVVYFYLFTQNNLLTPSILIVMAVLCTFTGRPPELRRARIDDTSRYRSPLPAQSASG